MSGPLSLSPRNGDLKSGLPGQALLIILKNWWLEPPETEAGSCNAASVEQESRRITESALFNL